MKKLFILLSLLLMLLMAGCGKQEEQIELPSFRVTFTMAGHVCSTQTVWEGHLPRSVLTNVPGLRFVQWLDENAEPASPYTTFVHQNLNYTAEVYPSLPNHVPYLFVDDNGNIRPDDPLRADELIAALEALAEEDAKAYFPSMPTGDEQINQQTLTKILAVFFPQAQVQEQFSGSSDQIVSRSSFAWGMHRLLGRDDEEIWTAAEDAKLPKDITREREDTLALLEASVPHVPTRSGTKWSKVQLPVKYTPGFLMMDGWLYYVQSDYKFLKGGDFGSFHFDAQGRYTSSDAQLDQMVAQILVLLAQENPSFDKYAMLRAAFDYCCQYEVVKKDHVDFGQTGWETEEAKLMFLDEKGDSYNFAAAFWALAKGMGFDAKVVSGTRGIYDIPHGWVIITIDGERYFFDPATQLDNPKEDMYMFKGNKVESWNYKWVE